MMSGKQVKGKHNINLPLEEFSAGVYFYRLAKGIYFYQVRLEDGIVTSGKVVKD